MKTNDLKRYLTNWQSSAAPGSIQDLKVDVSVHKRTNGDSSPFAQAFAVTWIYWTQRDEVFSGKRFVHAVAFFGHVDKPSELVSNSMAYNLFTAMADGKSTTNEVYLTPEGDVHHTHPYRKKEK